MHSHASFNIIGRVGRCEVDSFTSVDGQPRKSVVLAIATDDHFRKDAEGKPLTHWHRITAYAPHLVQLADSLKQGRLVWLEGQIEQRTEGEGEARRYFTNFVAEQLGFLDPKPKAAREAAAAE